MLYPTNFFRFLVLRLTKFGSIQSLLMQNVPIPILSEIMHFVLAPENSLDFWQSLKCWMLVCKFWRHIAFEYLQVIKGLKLQNINGFPTNFKSLKSLQVITWNRFQEFNPCGPLQFPVTISELKIKFLGDPKDAEFDETMWFQWYFSQICSQLVTLKFDSFVATRLSWVRDTDMSNLTRLQTLKSPKNFRLNSMFPPNLENMTVLFNLSKPDGESNQFDLSHLTRLSTLEAHFESPGDALLLKTFASLKKLVIIVDTDIYFGAIDSFLSPSLESLSINQILMSARSLRSNVVFTNLKILVLNNIKSFGDAIWTSVVDCFPNLKHLGISMSKYIPTKNKVPLPLAYFAKSLSLTSLEINDYFGEDLRPIRHVILRITSLKDYNSLNYLYFLKGIKKVTIRCFLDDKESPKQLFFPIVTLFNFIRPLEELVFLDSMKKKYSFWIDSHGKITHEHKHISFFE